MEFIDPTKGRVESDSATTETSSADEQSTEEVPLQPAEDNTFNRMWEEYNMDDPNNKRS